MQRQASLNKKVGNGRRRSTALFAFEKNGATAADYMADGDHSMYTSENLAKRQAIRDDQMVQGWLTSFYRTFFSSQDINDIADEIPRELVAE
jgi:hypothetical protein